MLLVASVLLIIGQLVRVNPRKAGQGAAERCSERLEYLQRNGPAILE